jgi:predicted nuclease of predicted toxin-antitoxin system
MKFLADMGISPMAVKYLRDSGHDAVHLHEENLDRMSDAAILEKARQEARVVLTSDLDFSDLVAASGTKLPSVVIFRLKDMRPGNVNRYLEEILSQYSPLLMEGVIASVTEKRIRIRRLPIR